MIGLLLIREELNLSAATLAKKLGIAKPTISQWEHGARKIPVERVKQLSEILNVPQEYFGDITASQVEEIKAILAKNKQQDEHNFEFEEYNQATKELKAALQQINVSAKKKSIQPEPFSDYISKIKYNTGVCTLFAEALMLYDSDPLLKRILSIFTNQKAVGGDRIELIQSLKKEIAATLDTAEQAAIDTTWSNAHKKDFEELY